jgi:hypothetical protein
MSKETAFPGSSANNERKSPKSLKSYSAPQFKILTPEEALVELRGKALPGDAGAQQLLRVAEVAQVFRSLDCRPSAPMTGAMPRKCTADFDGGMRETCKHLPRLDQELGR